MPKVWYFTFYTRSLEAALGDATTNQQLTDAASRSAYQNKKLTIDLFLGNWRLTSYVLSSL